MTQSKKNGWSLYTRKDGYLSISPDKWRKNELSTDTQVTIVRSERISRTKRCFVSSSGTSSTWTSLYYPKCQQAVLDIMKRAVRAGALQEREETCRQQFE